METPALTDDSTVVEKTTQVEPTTCHADALTQPQSHSRRCGNPFCEATARSTRSHGRYCSDACRMDGYALRRAKALRDRVGSVEFHRLLDQV